MLDPVECKQRAEDCLDMADASSNARLKALYRSMARCWLSFADRKVRPSSLRERSVDQLEPRKSDCGSEPTSPREMRLRLTASDDARINLTLANKQVVWSTTVAPSMACRNP
jgi:hypothetical protein